MNNLFFIRQAFLPLIPSAFLLLALVTHVTALSVFAGNCEIVKADKYQKSQRVIVTDWYYGAPYMKETVETYQCANITFKNTFWQGVYSSDMEITAVFEDQRSLSKRIECEKKRLEFGDTYSCSVCFEHESPIADIQCALK